MGDYYDRRIVEASSQDLINGRVRISSWPTTGLTLEVHGLKTSAATCWSISPSWA